MIDWVVQEGFEDAIRAHPAINRVIGFPRHGIQHWWRSPSESRRAIRFFRGLRGRYDLVVDAQGLARSGLMARVSGGRRRIGFADAAEGGWLGYTERITVREGLPAVDRMLALLEGAGIEPVTESSLFVPEDVEPHWSSWKSASIGDQRYIALAPTSRWVSKEWPADRWSELAARLIEDGHAKRIVLLGGPGEVEQLAEIARGRPEIKVLAGQGSLAFSMAAVRDSSLVVANDSAMLHAAAGLSVPLIGLFGPTSASISGPFGRTSDCISSPEGDPSLHYRDKRIGDRVMRGISLRSVLDACVVRLSPTEASASEEEA
ncbi:MAG: glycosyltransferase family 9 protein [Phycisphaerales bacterium]|nr:glycosyltransferase family 9 protein [Phycisphaerales bacterium]